MKINVFNLNNITIHLTTCKFGFSWDIKGEQWFSGRRGKLLSWLGMVVLVASWCVSSFDTITRQWSDGM